MKISKEISDNWVIVKNVEIEDKRIVKRLESIGIFPGQRIFIKNIGNLKNMISITTRNVSYAFRESELNGIDVKLGDKNE